MTSLLCRHLSTQETPAQRAKWQMVRAESRRSFSLGPPSPAPGILTRAPTARSLAPAGKGAALRGGTCLKCKRQVLWGTSSREALSAPRTPHPHPLLRREQKAPGSLCLQDVWNPPVPAQPLQLRNITGVLDAVRGGRLTPCLHCSQTSSLQKKGQGLTLAQAPSSVPTSTWGYLSTLCSCFGALNENNYL